MIPLSYFLLAWFIFFVIYAMTAFISVIQMLRFGIAGMGTYLSTGIFLSLSLVVILSTSLYFLTVDWQQGVNIFSRLSTTFINP